jgi:hypothetical protein
MDIWAARDAYRAQILLWVLAGIALLVLFAWLGGCALWFEQTHP